MSVVLNITDAAISPLKAAFGAVLTKFSEFTDDHIFLVGAAVICHPSLCPPPFQIAGGLQGSC